MVVRVDARTRVASDYVERCVDALEATGAAIVGGPMRLTARSPAERAIRTAMTSRFGVGGAQFRRHQGQARFVDTVYLGAYRVDTVRGLGGYDEWFGGNEDAELAYRARRAGGVFLDPAISSTYAVRKGLGPLCQQYFRYGTNRTRTMIKHPRSIALRQLAVPCLLLGLVSPWRRPVAAGYAALVAGRAAVEMTRDPAAAPWLLAVVPVMHGAWGAGFLRAVAGARSRSFDTVSPVRGLRRGPGVVMTEWLGRGGIAHTAEAWVTELGAVGSAPHLVTCAGRELAGVVDGAEAASGRGGALGAHVAVVRATVRALSERRPSFLVLHGSVLPQLELAAVRAAHRVGAAVVLVAHEPGVGRPTPGSARAYARLVRSADVVVCHSEYVADRLRVATGRLDSAVLPLPLRAPPARRCPRGGTCCGQGRRGTGAPLRPPPPPVQGCGPRRAALPVGGARVAHRARWSWRARGCRWSDHGGPLPRVR